MFGLKKDGSRFIAEVKRIKKRKNWLVKKSIPLTQLQINYEFAINTFVEIEPKFLIKL